MRNTNTRRIALPTVPSVWAILLLVLLRPSTLTAQGLIAAAPAPTPYSSLPTSAGPTTTPALPEDSPTSSHPVERTVASATILRERTVVVQPGVLRRTRLLRSNIQPWQLRAEEEWRQTPSAQEWVAARRDLYVADRIILQVRSGVPPDRLLARLPSLIATVEERLAEDLYALHLTQADLESMPEALAALGAQSDLVALAEPDGVGFGGAIPNDPQFAVQWGFHNTGQSGGTADADVDAPELWDLFQSAPGLVIAVLDSGLNFTHPDLQDIAWQNPGEIPGDGLDNDGSGRIDDVTGWDFVNNDNHPADDHGHGSNVTGIMAANPNNGQGIAGLVGGVQILICKILNSSNSGLTSHLIAAVTYARQRGAPIMNLSLQNYPFSSSLNTEFTACETQGILLSICAGNQGVDNDFTPNYPSCYPQSNIIAVGNHDRTDVRWSGTSNPSNYGANSVDVFAPGREIYSPVLGTAYAYYTGTSQATPFVTAMGAILKYLNPPWRAPELKNSILASALTRPAYAGICTTGGRLNALAALSHAIRHQPATDTDGDRFPNLFEYLAGTRVDAAANYPPISCRSAGGFLRLEGPQVPRPDAHFVIETSTNLSLWTTNGVTDFSTPNLLSGGIPVLGAPLGFLRIGAVGN